MNEAKPFTIEEAHRHFAKTLNAEVWDLLQQPERSALENERMLHGAHASCYHWMQVGTPMHQQRAEWLIARVCTVLGYPEPALRHAARCLELTHEHDHLMHDFDRAYACEGMARASAMARNLSIALQYITLAEAAALEIQNEEDRGIFLADFEGGEWYGARGEQRE